MCILTPYSSTATTLMTLMTSIYPEPSSPVIKDFQNVHTFNIVIDVLNELFYCERIHSSYLVRIDDSWPSVAICEISHIIDIYNLSDIYSSHNAISLRRNNTCIFFICFFFYYDLGLWSHNLELNGLRKKGKEMHCSVYEWNF